jgi:hypothetical protein
MKGRILTVLGALAWLALIVVIALGASGIVAAMDQPPTTDARPDLTAPGDAEVTPLLDAAQADLAGLADEVDSLGTEARGALAALNGVDIATADAALAVGDRLVTDIDARTSRIRAALAAVPYVGTATQDLVISAPVAARHADLVAALDATNGLHAAWARLTQGSITATRMSGLLADHDRLAGKAADLGRQAKYKDALSLLDQATAQITAARALRDELVNTVDVTVLDEWLSRNEDYDTALRTLYVAISSVKGKVTNDVRDAIAGEKAAKARLPPDDRGLVIIMAEIGRGGMSGAVIAIEEARGKLEGALDALAPASPAPDGAGAPTGAPTRQPPSTATPEATTAP